MTTHVRCGELFTGAEDSERRAQTLAIDDAGRLTYVGATDAAPIPARGDRVLDYGEYFVMPGLQDVHTHLAYGNAKTEEDIDLYHPMEFRAIRALFLRKSASRPATRPSAHRATPARSACRCATPSTTGCSTGRASSPGRYLTTRQSLTDWYPTWIGAPDTSIGRLVTSRDEAIEEIRVQVKNGVDCIKVALDGVQRRPDGELIAAFNQDETSAIVSEAHRLGRKVVVHARGREATLYAARAGVDLGTGPPARI
jgi:imidazolonepropionase-like amidohydrolase